jgi:hypothetical protein
MGDFSKIDCMVLLGEFQRHFLSYGHPWTITRIILKTTTSFPSLTTSLFS